MRSKYARHFIVVKLLQSTKYKLPYVFTAGSAGNDLQHYYMYNGNTDKTELLIEGAKNEHFGNFDGDYFGFWIRTTPL